MCWTAFYRRCELFRSAREWFSALLISVTITLQLSTCWTGLKTVAQDLLLIMVNLMFKSKHSTKTSHLSAIFERKQCCWFWAFNQSTFDTNFTLFISYASHKVRRKDLTYEVLQLREFSIFPFNIQKFQTNKSPFMHQIELAFFFRCEKETHFWRSWCASVRWSDVIIIRKVCKVLSFP